MLSKDWRRISTQEFPFGLWLAESLPTLECLNYVRSPGEWEARFIKMMGEVYVFTNGAWNYRGGTWTYRGTDELAPC